MIAVMACCIDVRVYHGSRENDHMNTIHSVVA
jgi:hypothetical protein